MVNVAWEEQANGPEGAYCRVLTTAWIPFIVKPVYVMEEETVEFGPLCVAGIASSLGDFVYTM